MASRLLTGEPMHLKTAWVVLLLSCSSAIAPTRDVQALVDDEVATLSRLPGSRVVVVAVLEPSGRVVALGGSRAGVVDRTLASTVRRDPGSVMKTFSIGAALEAGLVTPTTVVDGGGGHLQLGDRAIDDQLPHGPMTVDDVMAFSSNVGTARVFLLLGHERLQTALHELGLPTPPMGDDQHAVGVAYGADVLPTPLELASAFAMVASGRAFPSHHAEVMQVLQHTVDRDDGTGHGARIEGVAVAGKTGTYPLGDDATYGDFVGAFPAAAPKYVVLVGVETTQHGYTGGSVAAPAFARLGTKLLLR
jgi:cell division protein FtsI (penicillin-binding protein 3)